MDIQTKYSLINNNPNFKGVYILKGISEDVNIAKEIIWSKCGNDTAKLLYKNRKFIHNFNEFASINLTDIFGDAQKNVKCLIATNEHFPNVINWRKIFQPSSDMPKIRCPYSHEPMNWDEFKKGMEFLEKRLVEIKQKIAPFKHAEECEKSGNSDPMCDILIDSYMQAKERLQQFKETATVAMGEIKELDAKEVLTAIKEKRFNFIDGVINNEPIV